MDECWRTGVDGDDFLFYRSERCLYGNHQNTLRIRQQTGNMQEKCEDLSSKNRASLNRVREVDRQKKRRRNIHTTRRDEVSDP